MSREIRNEIVKFRMTTEEKGKLQQQAKQCGMTVSDYIRKVTEKPPDVTKEEFNSSIQKTIYEIHKIGVNINQIAKKYNENNFVEPSENLTNQLTRIYGLMKYLSEFLEVNG